MKEHIVKTLLSIDDTFTGESCIKIENILKGWDRPEIVSFHIPTPCNSGSFKYFRKSVNKNRNKKSVKTLRSGSEEGETLTKSMNVAPVESKKGAHTEITGVREGRRARQLQSAIHLQ